MFKLVQRSTNKSLTKFHVLNSADEIIGSINVPPEQVADLLRHWAGPVDGPKQQHAPLRTGEGQGTSAMARAMMARKPRPAISQAAILRGCL